MTNFIEYISIFVFLIYWGLFLKYHINNWKKIFLSILIVSIIISSVLFIISNDSGLNIILFFVYTFMLVIAIGIPISCSALSLKMISKYKIFSVIEKKYYIKMIVAFALGASTLINTFAFNCGAYIMIVIVSIIPCLLNNQCHWFGN